MTPVPWRWDQGRLGYFSLNSMRRIARALYGLNRLDLAADARLMRATLEAEAGLPFLPTHYQVWRNYARVFKMLGLASRIDGKLVATGLCEALAETDGEFITNDDYMHYLTRTFYYPSPVFEGYSNVAEQKFPFCAVLKYVNSTSKCNSTGRSKRQVAITYLLFIPHKRGEALCDATRNLPKSNDTRFSP